MCKNHRVKVCFGFLIISNSPERRVRLQPEGSSGEESSGVPLAALFWLLFIIQLINRERVF